MVGGGENGPGCLQFMRGAWDLDAQLIAGGASESETATSDRLAWHTAVTAASQNFASFHRTLASVARESPQKRKSMLAVDSLPHNQAAGYGARDRIGRGASTLTGLSLPNPGPTFLTRFARGAL